MPVHDWSRVNAGIFHSFHGGWITHLNELLNAGILPPDYYALAEQVAGSLGPDVWTLKAAGSNGYTEPAGPQGTTAVAVAPPRVRVIATTEMDEYVLKQRTLVIRHSSDDRVIALIEIVSLGNKASRHALRSFVEKAATALARGIHLLVVDLHSPGPRDPHGIHGAVWAEVSDDSYRAPPDKPLTLAAYSAGAVKTAYVEPFAVGDALPDMPLFLTPEHYVSVPLEATYQAAWRGTPRRWREVLEGPGA